MATRKHFGVVQNYGAYLKTFFLSFLFLGSGSWWSDPSRDDGDPYTDPADGTDGKNNHPNSSRGPTG